MSKKEKTTISELEKSDSAAKSNTTTPREIKHLKKPSVIGKLPLQTKIIVVLVAILTVAVGILFAVLKNDKSQLTTISKSSLQEIIEINELSTVEYIYNAIATKQDKNKNDMYYVAYEGKVTAGIDFTKIGIDIYEEEKIIKITIPEIEIHDTSVNMGTLKYIFVKDKYETENVSQEAYKLCIADLNNRIKKENVLFETAKENAVSTVEALFEPWVETVDGSYSVVIE